MALQEVTTALLRRLRLSGRPIDGAWALQCRRTLSTEFNSNTEAASFESTDFAQTNTISAKTFDPVARARRRNKQLPPSRYQFRPPRYDRGPLHPHRSPKPSDISSREFIPGPFSLPRLEQTYHSTFAPDLMTMTYTHFPPGTHPQPKGERLRTWEGDNPYFKGRPKRGPRGGGSYLRLLRQPITFRNVPELTKVTVHTMVKQAAENSAHLHVAGMILQAITGVRATVHQVKKSDASLGIRAGQHLSLTCELEGETMFHFLSKVVDVVMPKMKDFRGIKGSTGDGSGNLGFGITEEETALFPEVEVNYDSYPPKMIPGCHIVVHTSARTDRDARLLLRSIGIPFKGKMVD